MRADTGLNCGNSAGFVTLGPRQQLTIAPYAGFAAIAQTALNATTANSATTATTATSATSADNALQLNSQSAAFYLARSNHTGTLPGAALSGSYTSPLTLSNAANSFSGSGSGLTALNASNISAGLLSPSRGGTGSDTSAATSGQVLKFNGSTWAPAADFNTAYTAGSGLSLVGTVFSVPTNGINSLMVADNTLTANDIGSNAITNDELASDALSLSKVTGGAATSSGSNIGIGAAVLGSSRLNIGGNLNVTGNTSIGGTTTTDAVILPATSRVYSIPMVAFYPYQHGGQSLLDVTDVEVTQSSVTGVDDSIFAPVYLPHGAVVTGLFAHLLDDSNTDASVNLIRRGVDGAAGGTMATATSSGNTTGTRVFSDLAISSPTVDNNAFHYAVRVNFSPTVLNPNAPSLRGIRVTYTITAPLP